MDHHQTPPHHASHIASTAILLPRRHRINRHITPSPASHRRHLPPPAEQHHTVLLLPPAAYHRRAKRRNLPPSLSSRERLNRVCKCPDPERDTPPLPLPLLASDFKGDDGPLVGRSARACWREISPRPCRASIRPAGSVTTRCSFDGEYRWWCSVGVGEVASSRAWFERGV